MATFSSSDILLPKSAPMATWAVIACDQFVSQPEYWQRVRQQVGSAPSSLQLILPEADLGVDDNARIEAINQAMLQYQADGVFQSYPAAYIYVERTLQNGSVRKGIVGAVDLEDYDYTPGSGSPIRATERTVAERIPPRMNIRRNASLELPHVLLLCDDPRHLLLDSVEAKKASLPLVYDFDLMEEGGHIRGWLVTGKDREAFDAALADYESFCREKFGEDPVYYAVGDGNHSLASAKGCYEELKASGQDMTGHPARYALVELENIHDDSQQFEPIHRIVKDTDPAALLAALQAQACAEGGYPLKWFAGEKSGTVMLKLANGQLPVGALQNFLDNYLSSHAGETDYIHGDKDLTDLSAQPNAIGFLLPAMEKGQLFPGIIADGVLPRKTFSMGHAREKRYYLEARKIR